ncbi:MAG: hypothetical protein CMK59_00805 [Proteobacteria bacterium]|nr:hypothetical protein [Pseudomonadota bacterium]
MSKLERRQHSFLLRASSPLLYRNISPPKGKPITSIIKKLELYHTQHHLLPPIFVQENSGLTNKSIIAGAQIYWAATQLNCDQIRIIPFLETPPTPSLFLRIFYYIYSYLEPIERGVLFQTLLKNGYTQRQLASHIGIGRSSISHYTNLLKLPLHLKNALTEHTISVSYAKELSPLTEIEMQLALQKILSENMTIPQLRKWIIELRKTRIHTPIEDKLKKRFGTKIKIKTTPEGGKSELSIRFESIEQLKSFAEDLLAALPTQQNESGSLHTDQYIP